ncbi:hypothetical protein, partial [Collinsella sp. OF02-10]|uniref:hypothetical protein n=1 Tax=Collinsella sp. OF02-10 TaxID=2292324 RepID=UPI001F29D6AE
GEHFPVDKTIGTPPKAKATKGAPQRGQAPLWWFETRTLVHSDVEVLAGEAYVAALGSRSFDRIGKKGKNRKKRKGDL